MVRTCWLLEETNHFVRFSVTLAGPVCPCFQKHQHSLRSARVGLATSPNQAFPPGFRMKLPDELPSLAGLGFLPELRGPSGVNSPVRGALAGRSRVRYFPGGLWCPLRKPVARPSRHFPHLHPCGFGLVKHRSSFDWLNRPAHPSCKGWDPHLNCFKCFDRELGLVSHLAVAGTSSPTRSPWWPGSPEPVDEVTIPVPFQKRKSFLNLFQICP